MHWLHEVNGGERLGRLIPENAAAIKAERQSAREFGFPLLTRTVIVQHDASGIPWIRQLDAMRLAFALSSHQISAYKALRGAVPVSNAIGWPQPTHGFATTVLTYLFMDPQATAATQRDIAQSLVRTYIHPAVGETVGVTGSAPALTEESAIINSHLMLVELATLGLVLVAMVLHFRSLGAPLAALAAITCSYLVGTHVVAWLGEASSIPLPAEVKPVMVVLIFGIVTDYSIFYLAHDRELLAQGHKRLAAAERTAASTSPIVAAAALTVSAATAAVLVAHLRFFHDFGAGVAIAVVITLMVVVTLMPAILATFGRALYWPRGLPAQSQPNMTAGQGNLQMRFVRRVCRHPWLGLASSIAVIGGLAWGLHDLRLGNPLITGLPPNADAHRAYGELQATSSKVYSASAASTSMCPSPSLCC